jgi:hypothetical protein
LISGRGKEEKEGEKEEGELVMNSLLISGGGKEDKEGEKEEKNGEITVSSFQEEGRRRRRVRRRRGRTNW